eukprot:scaffold2045_cov404-Prasinococcus_capsulatus_cf.AAC.32
MLVRPQSNASCALQVASFPPAARGGGWRSQSGACLAVRRLKVFPMVRGNAKKLSQDKALKNASKVPRMSRASFSSSTHRQSFIFFHIC